MSKVNLKSKKMWKNILAIVLSCVLAIGSIVGITALFEKIDETTTKTITPTYKVGGINTKTGKGDSSITSSIYTKDAFECQGLKITPDFDSSVSYEVFFYDSYEQFLSSSGTKTDFYESNNKLAKYARIVITPNEDDKVSWFETSKYANQLKVEVDKDQVYDLSGVNLFSFGSVPGGKVYDGSLVMFRDINEYEENSLCSNPIRNLSFKKLIVKIKDVPAQAGFIVCFADVTYKIVHFEHVQHQYSGSYDYVEYEIDVPQDLYVSYIGIQITNVSEEVFVYGVI